MVVQSALFNAYDSLCVTKIKHNIFKVIALFIITRFARLYVRVRVLLAFWKTIA